MTKQLSTLDMQGNQLVSPVAHQVAGQPNSPKNGQWWFNTSTGKIEWKNNSGVVDPTARASHTGTQTADTISDLKNTVILYRLDEFGKPTATLDFNNQQVNNLPAPGSPNSPARLIDLQNAQLGLDWKDNVLVATTANITLSGLQTIDTVAVTAGKRVLVKNQTTASQNGIYEASAGAWTRAADATQDKLTSGAVVTVSDGSATQKGTAWRLSTTDPITVGTTAQTWIEFARPFVPVQGTGIIVSGSTISVDTVLIPRMAYVTIGDGTNTTYTVQHNLNNIDTICYTRLVSTGEKCELDVVNADANYMTLSSSVPVPAGGVRCIFHG